MAEMVANLESVLQGRSFTFSCAGVRYCVPFHRRIKPRSDNAHKNNQVKDILGHGDHAQVHWENKPRTKIALASFPYDYDLSEFVGEGRRTSPFRVHDETFDRIAPLLARAAKEFARNGFALSGGCAQYVGSGRQIVEATLIERMIRAMRSQPSSQQGLYDQ